MTARFEQIQDKKLSYRRETARCAISLEIFSTAAHLNEKSHIKVSQ